MSMRRSYLNVFSILLFIAVSCSKDMNPESVPAEVDVKDTIKVMSPVPVQQITKVALNEVQKGYVEAGNSMAFRFLDRMYEGKNVVCSPLSLQYALSMAANGASGQTLHEIVDFFGYGDEGIDALNAYNKILLEQLPAVDLDVKLKVTDALIVNNMFPLLPSFKETVENNYYAAVDNMDFSDPDQVASRLNEWARRSTDGFIDEILKSEDISKDAVAFIMNALYFKAKWADDIKPMFDERYTAQEDFTETDGNKVKLDMMRTTSWYWYAEMDGYLVLKLPFAGKKFNMYFLLPDKNDVAALVAKLQKTSWSEITESLKNDAEVRVKIPKFDIENKSDLTAVLQSFGISKAFQSSSAEFDNMFQSDGLPFWISKVIQKSRISVTEWGTEAGSVTVVDMEGAAGDQPQYKIVNFNANHPFVFVIGEETSGTILFEGVFTGN